MQKIVLNIRSLIEKNNWIVVFLLFFPFIYKIWLPDGTGFYYIDSIKDYWKMFSFVVVVALFLTKKKKPSKPLIIVSVMGIWTIVVTAINNSNGLYETILFVIAVIVLSSLVELFIDDIDNMINGLMLSFELFLYMNFVTIIAFHSTKGFLEHHYLLGYYNTLIVFTYPAIAVSSIYMHRRKKYVRPTLLIIVSILTLVLAGGSTPLGSLIGTFGIIVTCIILNKLKMQIKHKAIILFIVAIIFSGFILFVFEGGKYKIIDFVIEKLLNRNTTFTGRLGIWKRAEEMFLNNPIVGYGRETIIRVTNFGDFIHCHNEYLTILVFTGIIGFVLFILFNFVILDKFDKQKESLLKYVLLGLLFGIFLSYVTECYQKEYMFYIIFFLAYHLDKIGIKEDMNYENLTK